MLDLKRAFNDDGFYFEINTTLDMSNVDYYGICPLRQPVVVKGCITNHSGLVELKLGVDYTYTAPCDRCANEVSKGYHFDYSTALATSIEGEESDTILVIENMQLNVEELVYCEVIGDLPTKFLCDENCRGLCSSCGKNLNEGECDCNGQEIDPRFAELAKLLK